MAIGSISGATAVFSTMEKQQRFFDSLSRASAIQGMIDRPQELSKQILASIDKSSVQAAIRGHQQEMQQRALRVFTQSSVLDAMGSRQQELSKQILASIDKSSVINAISARQLEMQKQIIRSFNRSSAMQTVLENWTSTIPPGFADQLAVYKENLLADVAARVPADVAYDDEEDGVWFGAESWSRLVWEMVTILKCAELMTAGMTVAKYGMSAPVPNAVMYLLYMFIAAGELAAHLAEDAFDSDED